MMNEPPFPGFQPVIMVRKVKLIVTVSKTTFWPKKFARACSKPPLKGQALTIPVA